MIASMISNPQITTMLRYSSIIVFAALVVNSCSTAQTGTQTPKSAKFSLPKLTNPWQKIDPKYAGLADGLLAGEIGSQLSDGAKKQALEAEYQALERSKSGISVPWRQSAELNGKVTPYPPYQVGSSNCRRYEHAITAKGVVQQSAGTACRDKNGIWTPLS